MKSTKCVELLEQGCKNNDVLPSPRILAVVLADRKTRRSGNDGEGDGKRK